MVSRSNSLSRVPRVKLYGIPALFRGMPWRKPLNNKNTQSGGRSVRPAIGSVTLCLIATLYILLVTNRMFWTKAYGYFIEEPAAFAGFVVGISAVIMALFTFFSAKYITKPILIFFVLVASVSSWFNDQFGVIIDKEMIRNAAVSTGAEAGHLITTRFLTHVLLTGVLPSLVIASVRIVHRPILKKLAYNTAVILSCVAIFMVAGISFYKTYAGVGRAHRDMMDTLNPVVPITSVVRYIVDSTRNANVVAQPLGTDARRVGAVDNGKPRVTIIVAGETARAQNFSLGGYGKMTNPELAKQNIVYFPNTTSCGTATATSIPCLFSVYPRAQYSHRKGLETENLLDVLTHAKVDVTWLDNDTGSYNVTDRVPYTYLPPSADPRFCKDGECHDAILVDKIDNWLDHIKGDSVLVLHQLGSHGPAYYQRYPEEFRRFTPDCRANDFGKCSQEQINNAYDNTILYTDHIVSAVIDKLKQRSATVSGAVMYFSDHGESLGENGIYLHGTPYIIAPPEQIHVPFLVWMADDLAKIGGYDMSCVAKQATEGTHSHDNIFHSVLGMMDIATKVYDPSLDVFAACRHPANKLAQLN
ncbi:phosphoethanolamine--lipid A transferase [Agrobacterium rhizogenes]|uniref:phosphoethanolamine transferase n=1 Tax=Rhizobium rhizogenes TaxID=359 RepID=UPI0004D734E1|nr:phosphoethanolamine--lipid A transferase [Rhizobium rhizogenes]KEA06054.1 sulfatase [Rhizobium rhizogenes]MDJ1637132.1 phosphoethanolamine--lipid A transferase [Rhizobium rhizogenes]MQB32642.1 phosphoethanolamine--lipid A transferase [Rhizobium rhizogenes]NTF68872.1 phosphoethanolamine--lipid A transferase [Rhizobium rhizogenes]NTG08226.1 phosphoethanolamine--lipid A transferase [Rhizobium rhizogenes]